MKRILSCLATTAFLLTVFCTGCSSETENESEMNSTVDASADIVFSGETIIDNDMFCYTVTALSFENTRYDCVITVTMENRTEDTYILSIPAVYLDGIETTSSLCEATVAANSSTTKSIYLTFAEETTTYTDIELVCQARTTSTYSNYDLYETAHIYPYGEESALVNDALDASETILLEDNDNLTIAAIAYAANADGDYQVTLYWENKTDEAMQFTVMEDVTINSKEITSNSWYKAAVALAEVPPYSYVYAYLTFSADDLTDLGITDYADIETVKFPASVTEAGRYATFEYLDETYYTLEV